MSEQPEDYTEDCCFNDVQDHCDKRRTGKCPCRCHMTDKPRPASEQEMLLEIQRCHRLLRDSDTARIRMNHRRIAAEEQLATERARAERAETELAAERERNQPLRDRIKALQDQHDHEIGPLRKKLAYYQDVWKRAVEHLKHVEEGKWTVLPSATERAAWGELMSRLEAAEGREARLRSDLLGLRRACLNKGGTTCRLCQGTWIASEGEKVSDHHDGCPMRQTVAWYAALAGTPEDLPATTPRESYPVTIRVTEVRRGAPTILPDEIDPLTARIAALEGALAYYAEIRNYSRAGGDPPDAEPFILSDRGARARAALAGEG